jgi:hypothetical protein
MKRTPTLENELLFENKTQLLTRIDYPFIGSVRRRLGSAGAEGLRGNEA